MKHTNTVPHEVVQMLLSESMKTRTMMEAIPLPPSSERRPAPTQAPLARRLTPAKRPLTGPGEYMHGIWRKGMPQVAKALIAGTALAGAGNWAVNKALAPNPQRISDTPAPVETDTQDPVKRNLVPHTPEAIPQAAPVTSAPKVQPLASRSERMATVNRNLGARPTPKRFSAPSVPHHVRAGAYAPRSGTYRGTTVNNRRR